MKIILWGAILIIGINVLCHIFLCPRTREPYPFIIPPVVPKKEEMPRWYKSSPILPNREVIFYGQNNL